MKNKIRVFAREEKDYGLIIWVKTRGPIFISLLKLGKAHFYKRIFDGKIV